MYTWINFLSHAYLISFVNQKTKYQLQICFCLLVSRQTPMVLNNGDKILIKNLCLFKNYGARKLLKEFLKRVGNWELYIISWRSCMNLTASVENLGVAYSILVFHVHVKKTGNNDDFIACLNATFNRCCLQVFVFHIR